MHIAKKNIHTKLYTYNLNIFYSADILLGNIVRLSLSLCWYPLSVIAFINQGIKEILHSIQEDQDLRGQDHSSEDHR